MAISGVTPILNVSDVPASLEWFESLGWTRGFTWGESGMIEGAASRDVTGAAHFASICAGAGAGNGACEGARDGASTPTSTRGAGAQIFLCCNGQGSRGTILPRWPGDDQTDGVWMSWWIDSIASLDALHEECVRRGYLVTMPPTNEPWGVREFHLRHPDGHMFRLSAGIPSAPSEGAAS